MLGFVLLSVFVFQSYRASILLRLVYSQLRRLNDITKFQKVLPSKYRQYSRSRNDIEALGLTVGSDIWLRYKF
jgi:hypothetical protein